MSQQVVTQDECGGFEGRRMRGRRLHRAYAETVIARFASQEMATRPTHRPDTGPQLLTQARVHAARVTSPMKAIGLKA